MELKSHITDEYFAATDFTPIHYENLIDLYDVYKDDDSQCSSAPNNKLEIDSFLDPDISGESKEKESTITCSSPLKLPSPVRFTTLEPTSKRDKKFNIESILSEPILSEPKVPNTSAIKDISKVSKSCITDSNTVKPNPQSLVPPRSEVESNTRYLTKAIQSSKYDKILESLKSSKRKESSTLYNKAERKIENRSNPEKKYYLPYQYHHSTEFIMSKLCYIPVVQHNLYSRLSLPYDQVYPENQISRRIEVLPKYNYSYRPKLLSQPYSEPITKSLIPTRKIYYHENIQPEIDSKKTYTEHWVNTYQQTSMNSHAKDIGYSCVSSTTARSRHSSHTVASYIDEEPYSSASPVVPKLSHPPTQSSCIKNSTRVDISRNQTNLTHFPFEKQAENHTVTSTHHDSLKIPQFNLIQSGSVGASSSTYSSSTITSPEMKFSFEKSPSSKPKIFPVHETNLIHSPQESTERFHPFDVEVSSLFNTEIDKSHYPDSSLEIEAIKKHLISEFERSKKTPFKQDQEGEEISNCKNDDKQRVYTGTRPSYLKKGHNKFMLGLKESTSLSYNDDQPNKNEDDDVYSDFNFDDCIDLRHQIMRENTSSKHNMKMRKRTMQKSKEETSFISPFDLVSDPESPKQPKAKRRKKNYSKDNKRGGYRSTNDSKKTYELKFNQKKTNKYQSWMNEKKFKELPCCNFRMSTDTEEKGYSSNQELQLSKNQDLSPISQPSSIVQATLIRNSLPVLLQPLNIRPSSKIGQPSPMRQPSAIPQQSPTTRPSLDAQPSPIRPQQSSIRQPLILEKRSPASEHPPMSLISFNLENQSLRETCIPFQPKTCKDISISVEEIQNIRESTDTEMPITSQLVTCKQSEISYALSGNGELLVDGSPHSKTTTTETFVVNDILESILCNVSQTVDLWKKELQSNLKRSIKKIDSPKKVSNKSCIKPNSILKKPQDDKSERKGPNTLKRRGRPPKQKSDNPPESKSDKKSKPIATAASKPITRKRKYNKQTRQNPYSTKRYPECPHGRPKPSRKITFDVAGVSTSVMITEHLDIRRWNSRIVGFFEIIDFPLWNLDGRPNNL